MGKMIQSNSAASNPLESEGEDIEITILSQKSLSPPAVKMVRGVLKTHMGLSLTYFYPFV
jgi:hypothetical protein